MDRSVEWRYPNPFRVTPPFGGDGHWEGSGYHWEQSGSGYIQVTGDEWYQFIITVDEGYDIPGDTKTVYYNNRGLNYIIVQSRIAVGQVISLADIQGYTDDGYEWTVYKCQELFAFSNDFKWFLQRTETTDPIHVAVLFDYWNKYKYENLQWQLVESGIRRNHV